MNSVVKFKDILSKYNQFEWILFGFIIFQFVGIVSIYSKLIAVLTLEFSLLILFFNAFVSIRSLKQPFSGLTQTLFFLYLIWSLFIIIRPFVDLNDQDSLRYSFSSPFQLLSYATPLIVFLGFEKLSLKVIFKYSYIYALIGIVLTIFYYRNIFIEHSQIMDFDDFQAYVDIATIPQVFLVSSAVIVLNYKFVSSKYRRWSFLALALGLLITLLTARRSNFLLYFLFFIFTLYLYVFKSDKKFVFINIIFIALIIGVSLSFVFIYSNSIFSLFFSRLDQDSRSGVEQYFYDSFRNKTEDWIFGRGINGTYFCPIFSRNAFRGTIETGYLQLILKGGIVYLVLFVFILLQSAFLGFFKSKNTLTKAMALFILAHVLYLIPFGIPSFSFEYLMVWIFALYCQSKAWRMKTNRMIQEELNLSILINKKISRK
jgi:hypothetical protein